MFVAVVDKELLDMLGVRVPVGSHTARAVVSCHAKKEGFGMSGTLKNQGKKQSKRSRPNRTLQVFFYLSTRWRYCLFTPYA